jgi:hypothetical protein
MTALKRDGDAVGDERLKVDHRAILQTVSLAELSGF